MVVCHEKKCIFIHIPKTGGTSIEQFIIENGKNNLQYHGVMNNRSLHHLTAFELYKNMSKNRPHNLYSKYYSFSIVRNPYERLLSEYYWTKIPNVGFKAGKSKDHFLKYVKNVVRNKLYFQHIDNDHFIPQFNFVYYKNKLFVNEIFKFEDFDWINNYLKKKLNIINDIPLLNKSIVNKKEEWNEEQKNIIYELYKKDFIIFNYNKSWNSLEDSIEVIV